MRNETIPFPLSQQKPTKVGMTHTSAGRCQPPASLYKQINAVKCTCMIRSIQFFQLVLKTLQNSKEIFPAHLKYILLTSIKMRVFNIESFLCPFHRTISEYFVILLCYRSTKRKECIFANCHKSRIIFPALAVHCISPWSSWRFESIVVYLELRERDFLSLWSWF